MSTSSQASAISPSWMRSTAVEVNSTLLPVASTPRKGPLWVPDQRWWAARLQSYAMAGST
jgi:hypothetical protein